MAALPTGPPRGFGAVLRDLDEVLERLKKTPDADLRRRLLKLMKELITEAELSLLVGVPPDRPRRIDDG